MLALSLQLEKVGREAVTA